MYIKTTKDGYLVAGHIHCCLSSRSGKYAVSHAIMYGRENTGDIAVITIYNVCKWRGRESWNLSLSWIHLKRGELFDPHCMHVRKYIHPRLNLWSHCILHIRLKFTKNTTRSTLIHDWCNSMLIFLSMDVTGFCIQVCVSIRVILCVWVNSHPGCMFRTIKSRQHNAQRVYYTVRSFIIR